MWWIILYLSGWSFFVLHISVWIRAPCPWYLSQSMTPSKDWQNPDRPLSITRCSNEMSSGSVCSRRRGLMGSDGTQQSACPQEQMAHNTPHFLVFFSVIEISYTEGSYQSLSMLHTFSLDLSVSQSKVVVSPMTLSILMISEECPRRESHASFLQEIPTTACLQSTDIVLMSWK